MKSNNLISVVVPAYNAESTIAETLKSVARQSYKNIEIIVVDDGSTDNTCNVVKVLAEQDERIILKQKPNGGPASARNSGISIANGDFLAPIDSDDIWHRDKLKFQLELLIASGDECAFVYSPCRLIDSESRVFRSLPLYEVNGSSFYQLCYYNYTQNGSSLLVRTKASETVGGYDESSSVVGREDLLFALKLAEKFDVACVPEYLVGYRQLDASLSKDIKKMHFAGIEAMNRISEIRNVDNRLYNWSINRSRIRWMNQIRKESGFNLLSLRLFLGAMFHDPRATAYSGINGFWRKVNRNSADKSARILFDSIDSKMPSEETLPAFVAKRLRRLAVMDSAVS